MRSGREDGEEKRAKPGCTVTEKECGFLPGYPLQCDHRPWKAQTFGGNPRLYQLWLKILKGIGFLAAGEENCVGRGHGRLKTAPRAIGG